MSNDLAQLMEQNLTHVWSERDKMQRLAAIELIYAKDASLFHVGDKTSGHEAINESAHSVINGMPPDFTFTVLKSIVINNDVGRLVWGVGPAGVPPVATGMDIAIFEDGKIKSLYVFLD